MDGNGIWGYRVHQRRCELDRASGEKSVPTAMVVETKEGVEGEISL